MILPDVSHIVTCIICKTHTSSYTHTQKARMLTQQFLTKGTKRLRDLLRNSDVRHDAGITVEKKTGAFVTS